MNKKIVCFFLGTVFISTLLSGCGQDGNTGIEQSSSVVMVDGTFDIEAVRNSINIKGHKFTVPQKLSELEEGLTYEFVDEEFGDGFYMVEISDENGLVLSAVADNAYKKSKKAFVSNIALKESDSDVAGIVPLVSTKKDVLKKFGEPDDKKTSSTNEQKEYYYYGFRDLNDSQVINGKIMTIAFNSSGVVEVITVNYSE
ncbi:MAG: hypothetical protein J6B75_07435 [Ruminococcus sp.]|nr:hypothetical protein [Ruminococcus sp.]